MLNCIVVDDEQNAINRLERLINADTRIALKKSFLVPSEASEYIKHEPVDIAFLDIEMPQMTGLELAEILMDINPYIEIVFVTAYNQYAMDAFKAHATGYLLKPIDRDDFDKQISIMYKKLSKQKNSPKDTLYVSCLGSFAIYKSENLDEPVRFRTAKAEELLAFLINSEGRPKSRDLILDSLWPDIDPGRAANNFRVTCTYIRSTLTELGFSEVLLRDHDDYCINLSKIDCDYLKFRKGILAMDSLSVSEAETLAALYKGAYLENRFYDWADEMRSWLEGQYINLMYHIASLYKENPGKLDKSVSAYEAILSTDLYEEEALREILKIKASKTSATALKDYYEKYTKSLYSEYGSKPSVETQKLYLSLSK